MALTIGAIGVGSPAQASVAQGYIAGAGVLTDDWGDEGTISATTRNHSNAVWLWQVILIADGYLTSIDDVDCWFGERTTAATIRWQRARGLTADGKVGPNTFGRAERRHLTAANSRLGATFSLTHSQRAAEQEFQQCWSSTGYAERAWSDQGRPARLNSCCSRGLRLWVSRRWATRSSTPAALSLPEASARIVARRRAAVR
jgi:putative peptidoglycan binding protein